MSILVSWGVDNKEEKKIACYSNETGKKKKIATFDANNFANIFTAFKGTTDSEVTKRNVMKNINQYIYDLYLKILNNSYLVGEDQSFKNSKQKILDDFISKIKSNNEINKNIIDNLHGIKIGKLRNNNAKIDEFIKELCKYSGIKNDKKYDDYYFIPYNSSLTHGGYNYHCSIMLSPINYFKYKDNALKEYTNEYLKLSDIANFRTNDVQVTDSFKDYLNRNTAYYNDIILKYVPDNNEIKTWIKKYEDTLEDKGFKFGGEKEKIEVLVYYGNAGTSLERQTIEIPKYVTESSTKNKEEVVDQIIKYGFLGDNPNGSFITYATGANVMDFPNGEENYKIDKEIVGDYDIYKYGAKEIDFNNKVALGEYITNGLKYLHNNNTINSLVNNNANIKSYFNDNCYNFLKDYDSKSGFQEFNDVDNYYDFYSANTPYVSLTFRYRNDKGGIQEVNINSVEYPFIKSFNCVDEGVKTFTIKLFDRDFNSLINIYDDNSKKIGESTLEQILALSVGINNTKQKNNNEETKYSLTAANYGDVVGTKVSDDMQYNLGIIFGYSETNPKLTQGNSGVERETSTGYLSSNASTNGDYTYAGNTKYYTKDKKKQRTHRWWETSTESSESDNKTLLDRVNSSNQTTIRTELIKTLIIGYQTEFSSAGVYYTIKAIEASQSELSKYKIYQRYTNIKGTPSEVLYTVMNMVNGIFDSKDGGIKLYIDESCRNGKDIVIEDYEKEEESKNEDNVNKVQEPKQVQISLGSKDALSMYQDDLSNGLKEEVSFKNVKKPKLYKSVLSILNDLKAVMPPKVVDSGLMKDVIVTDQDGNSVKAIQKQNAYRRFTYGVQVDKDKKVKVYFYYQQPTKFKRIRKYEWGPANGKHSVITNIDIKTDNEYALLTSMSTITEKGASVISRDGHETGIIGKADYADYIAQPGDSTPLDQIAYAYSQALYKGSITIMGDPFYCFDKFVQPYTYPIYLDFRLPVSQSWSNSSNTENKIGYSHFMSGFYVVTKITHDINDSGFRTILEVMSYPNITNDVLGPSKLN